MRRYFPKKSFTHKFSMSKTTAPFDTLSPKLMKPNTKAPLRVSLPTKSVVIPRLVTRSMEPAQPIKNSTYVMIAPLRSNTDDKKSFANQKLQQRHKYLSCENCCPSLDRNIYRDKRLRQMLLLYRK